MDQGEFVRTVHARSFAPCVRLPLENTMTSYTPKVRPAGHLASLHGRPDLELQVLQSAAGFYLGTFCEEGPFTRESVEYFASRQSAEQALASGHWSQRPEP